MRMSSCVIALDYALSLETQGLRVFKELFSNQHIIAYAKHTSSNTHLIKILITILG